MLTVQKKLLISFREIIELIGVLVDFLPVRELTVDQQDLIRCMVFILVKSHNSVTRK